ncbi:MAG: holo-ACP synthase [Magnetococcus sp. DMHC-6]
MIVGIGTDLTSVARMEKILARYGERFLRRVFTQDEIVYCQSRRDQANCFAKRWAAKEALVKAMGTGMRLGIWFSDIAVTNDSFGRPFLAVTGEAGRVLQLQGDLLIHLSLSDEHGFALAFVILEKLYVKKGIGDNNEKCD